MNTLFSGWSENQMGIYPTRDQQPQEMVSQPSIRGLATAEETLQLWVTDVFMSFSAAVALGPETWVSPDLWATPHWSVQVGNLGQSRYELGGQLHFPREV